MRPRTWQDEYGRVDRAAPQDARTVAVPFLGRVNDPHRSLYGTLSFSLPRVRPTLIHAEEEPDSLTAVQILLARRLFAPHTPVILHTWQNVLRPKSWYVEAITRWVLRRADAILCANQEAVAVLGRMGYHGPTAVITPVGVDVDLFHPQQRTTHDQPFTAVYAGRFQPEKGIETLLQALALLGGDARCWLIGGGPAHAALQAEVQRLGLGERVVFVPPVPAEQMPNLLAQVDALVLPSRSTQVWREQFGRVLVEAMACGVPVVGSDSGAIPEVVGPAGLIFPEGDAAALAECLQRLRGTPDLRDRLIALGLDRARTVYSQACVAAQTAAFYRRIAQEVRPCASAST